MVNIINKPLRYISRDSIDRENASINNMIIYYKNISFIKQNLITLQNDLNVIKYMQQSIAIKYIRFKIKYEAYLLDYCNKKNVSYEELKEILDEFEDFYVKFKNINEILFYINEFNNSLILNNRNNLNDCVNLMTFHTIKGLEFDTVIIIDANDGIIPHRKSIKEKDIQTERRLFYVALTRAKNNLHIFFTTNRNGKNYKPSRFIYEGLKENK